MDLSATQVYEDEDEDLSFTQKIVLEEEESVQVGMLSIGTTDYQIKAGTTKIGSRLGSCDIVINDITVSGLHAEIQANKGEGSTWISDLNSTNKTKLNNTRLQPTRFYELKDGSVIEFGTVHATYRTYRPADDIVIPETPAPSRQKVGNTIIPNTPDSSLNNSSSLDDDGSVILGTQKDDENSVFRRPRIPQQCQSTSSKKNTSLNESNDSRIATLNMSDINIGKEQVSIFDAETQNFEEGCKMASSSIHDMETQGVLIDTSEHFVEANTKADKQLSKLNINKTASRSVMDIHDIETQSCTDDNEINEMETRTSKVNIQNVTKKKVTMDTYTMKRQVYTDDTDKGGSNSQKSEISKNNGREKNLAQVRRDIHDLETQKFDNNYIAEDVSDLETQLELDGIASEQSRDISNLETQLELGGIANEQSRDISDLETQLELGGIASEQSRDISNLETQLELGGIASEQNRDISDMETQFVTDDTANEKNDRANKDKDKDSTVETTNDGINHENITKSSRSSSPGSLNLSSPGVEDRTSSPLNQSDHLLESTYLLEFFGKDIDKQEKVQAFNASTPKSLTKVTLERNSNVVNMQNAVNSGENNDEDIFEALTQRNSRKFEALMSDDSETNEEDALIMRKVSKKTRGKPRLEQINDDSDTDAEEYVAELAKKQHESSGTLNKLSNEYTSNRNDPGTSVESEDIFDVLTQRLDNPTTKDTSDSSINQPQKTNEIDRAVDDIEPTQIINNIDQDTRTNMLDVNDVAPTQLILSRETSPKTVINSKDFATKNNQNDVDDMTTTHIINSKSVDCCTTENLDRENIDYELAPTQVIGEVEDTEKRNSTHKKDSPQASKADNEKPTDDDTDVESNKRRKIILSKTKNKSDGIMETLNDDNRNGTISSGNNEKSLRSSKATRQKDEAAPETSKEVLGIDSAKVEDAEENTSICIPCPSTDGQRAQKLDTLYEIDDDILTRLPAVRISGTVSNPASPSASSTSTVRSTRSKRHIAKNKREKRSSLTGKSPCEQNVGNSEKNDLREPSVDSHSNSVPDTPTTAKISSLVDTSEDSGTDSETDNETKYKRFQQMADRMLGNDLGCLKRQNKRRRKKIRVSPDVSEDPKQSMDVESNNPARTSSRITRHSSRQSDNSSPDLQREACAKNTAYRDKSTESDTKFTISKRKTSPSMVEEIMEQINKKKHKTAQVAEECPVSTRSLRSNIKTATDRQSPNNLNFTKMSTCAGPSMIENTKCSDDNKAVFKIALEKIQETSLNTETEGNVDSEGFNVRRTRRMIYDKQVMIPIISDIIANGSNKRDKTAQTKVTEEQASESQDKVLRVVLTPIKSPVDDASQEVERIMAKGPSNVQDKNLSVRESSNAKIFQRELRIRRRKRSNSDMQTESVLTESGISSELEDSDNTQLDNPAPRAKRGRAAKSSVFSLPESQASKKKETFKRPTRVKNSSNLTLDSSTENMISESSQGSTESDASTSSRVSRSKAASMKKKEKTELNQNTHRLIDESASGSSTSGEVISLSTPSKTRRSASILSNSTPFAMRHKVLFTGITDNITEDYSKIVKALGGSKVEDPAKCTILVTDKVRRTYKFLCVLAKGLPIVAIDWLRDSEAAARFLAWENYILKDPAAEAKFGFRLRKSLDKAKEKKLLDGYIVVLTPSIAPPPIEELKDMVSSCGGKALVRPPTKWPERAVVLSREEDLPNAKKFLAKAPKTVTVQSTEFILTGILRQETNFDKYKLKL
ncbi:mediator of DNA damage checkpoint protein 1-like isoform X2 [Temnothorax curvispinosus]|uniref:Mediator of DNA damage checkpoint protein 1 n=1 Tax=Temnothorax curvispinosus TaxID=300111 RepID=A0A6J1PRI2_9HYME|nr:mediator of DNA damage checkpoint protein 1-like isoform X2 [Temnothorax curvispinosus]